ncbi:Tyrosine aminotransferase [Linum perenne]
MGEEGIIGNNKWNFKPNTEPTSSESTVTIRKYLTSLMEEVNKRDDDDERSIIPLGHGDPSAFPCFRTNSAAEDAVVDSLRSGKFNCYAPSAGIPPARRAIAEYLSKDLPYKLSSDDVYLTVGCIQAIELTLAVLARPGANILLPRPGFPYYESRVAVTNLEARHFDLLPERGWEVDLEGIEALADENTVAMVIINPGNPCGCVYSYQHLKKVAETAEKLGILVIADEVYAHLTFGSNEFVPMGVFGSIVPVLTLGSISKRWIVPGWRLGWLVTNDPNGILAETGMVESIKGCFDISADPVTFIQGGIEQLIENTEEDFFLKIKTLLKKCADSCYDRIQKIPFVSCPLKPEGSMFVMVKLNLESLDEIEDDVDFCNKLAREESVIVLPGKKRLPRTGVGMKNWLRVTFAIDQSALEDGLDRIKAFCERHAKKE